MVKKKQEKVRANQEKEEQKKLQYLEFVHVLAVQALVCLFGLYEFAKEKSGPLKSGVNGVEGIVKSVIGPIYEKYCGIPFEMLQFVDQKLGKLISEVDQHMPSILKKAQTTACAAAHKAPEVARSVAGEVQRSGVVATAKGIAKDAYTQYEPQAKQLYDQYEPVAEQYAVSAWKSLNRLPLFSQVSQIVVPTAANLTEKYNKAVQSAASDGCNVAQYMPLVPTEKIAKVFAEDGKKPAEANVKSTPEPVATAAAQ